MKLKFWDDFVCGRAAYLRCVEQAAKPLGLSRTEMDILLFLANHPQFDTATDIVEKRRLSKAHVSLSLRSLRERGYLTAAYLQGNHRTMRLRLTEMAAPAVQAGQAAQRRFWARLTRDFTPEELRQLQSMLARMAQNLTGNDEEEAT